MRRPSRILLLALAAVVFVLISIGLARVLGANGAERTAIEQLVAAQARGDVAGVVARIEHCDTRPACRARARIDALRLRSPGHMQIVRLDLSTSFSLGSTHGVARVVWTAPGRTTVVQCIEVRRRGNVLRGLDVELQSLSRPIARESSCPSAS